MSEKPIKSKPVFYAVILPELQQIAKDNGYNLLVHGSMDRDLDLICVAWTNEPIEHLDLLEKFRKYLGAMKVVTLKGIPDFSHSVLDGGRDAYIIHLNYGYDSLGRHTEDQWYLDISFTPQLEK